MTSRERSCGERKSRKRRDSEPLRAVLRLSKNRRRRHRALLRLDRSKNHTRASHLSGRVAMRPLARIHESARWISLAISFAGRKSIAASRRNVHSDVVRLAGRTSGGRRDDATSAGNEGVRCSDACSSDRPPPEFFRVSRMFAFRVVHRTGRDRIAVSVDRICTFDSIVRPNVALKVGGSQLRYRVLISRRGDL